MSGGGIKLTEKELRYISLFSALTGTSVRDCVEGDDLLVFVVNKGDLSKALGRRGVKIQELANVFKKRLKVIEYSDDISEFITNALRPAQVKEIKLTERADGKLIAIARVDPNDKGMTIGKGGKNIELIRQVVKRYHNNVEHIIIQ